MSDIMGLIYTGEMDTRLRELTANRAIAAVPILSRYRLIDFPLSCMVNSGIRNIGIIMQRNYRSLLDHLGSGKEWDLHGKRAGLTILPPFLRSMKEKYIVLTNSFMLYNVDFEDMVNEHEKSGADITLMYTKDPGVRRSSQGKYCEVQPEGQVTQIEVDPMIARYENTMTEVFCMRRELLISLCDLATSRGHYHFTRQMLQNGVNEKTLKVNGYQCKSRVWAIDSVEAYYQCSLDLLDPENRKSIFPVNKPVLTKLRDEMPTRYLPGAKVANSLIADGCIIEGTVENCILFRGVRIGKDASIRNSIVMQDGRIGAMSEVNHCIMDKQSAVRESTRLMGAANYPVLVSKNLTV